MSQENLVALVAVIATGLTAILGSLVPLVSDSRKAKRDGINATKGLIETSSSKFLEILADIRYGDYSSYEFTNHPRVVRAIFSDFLKSYYVWDRTVSEYMDASSEKDLKAFKAIIESYGWPENEPQINVEALDQLSRDAPKIVEKLNRLTEIALNQL